MKTTERFDGAVQRLYNAFVSGKLDPWSNCACAVGNMCNGKPEWGMVRLLPMGRYGCTQILDQVEACKVRNITPKEYHAATELIHSTGYTIQEIVAIERAFLEAFHGGFGPNDIEAQFRGLCNVIELLCAYDDIPNVMDHTALFLTAKNELVS